MPAVRVEYRCKKHPKVVLGSGKKRPLDRGVPGGAAHPPGVIPEKPMYCPKCEKYYYGWESREREVKD